MLVLEWWWALILLPLPLLARRYLPAARPPEFALAVPLFNQSHWSRLTIATRSARLAKYCLWFFWICLIIAASRPLWLGDPISRSASGRDLMLAVDISGSMQEGDMRIDARSASRLEVLKKVVGEFIERREGDRLGLILFGSKAYSYVPLTFDLATLKQLLEDVSAGLAGRHTAIGDAIGLAVKSIRQQASEHKVLILITDGSNTAGINNPLLAARIAAEEGLTIHTIGVGSDEQSLSREYGSQSIPAGTALNETLLKSIAVISGGRYFRATNASSLEKIYAEINLLEPIEREYQSYRPRTELFSRPLAAALSILVFYLLNLIGQSSREEAS